MGDDVGFDAIFNVTLMYKMTYSAIKDKVTTVNVFYDAGAMNFTFGAVYPNFCDRSNNCVCDVMQESCPDTWALNGFGSRAECVNMLESLPYTQGDLAYFDGNSSGCRNMHAVFAASNTDHCAHLSFVPQADPNGKVKCQNSSSTSPENSLTKQTWHCMRSSRQIGVWVKKVLCLATYHAPLAWIAPMDITALSMETTRWPTSAAVCAVRSSAE